MTDVFDAHEELRSTVRRCVQDFSPATGAFPPVVPAPGPDVSLWTRLGERLGVAGLALPTEYGGRGLGPVAQLVVLEELGRGLVTTPYLATAVLAATALLESADPVARRDLLPGIASGRVIATMTDPDPRAGTVAARRTARGFRLTGATGRVIEGETATLLLVVAHTTAGPSLFAVDATDGLCRRPSPGPDPTRRYAEVGFSDTPARLVGPEGGSAPAIARTMDRAAIALAGEQVGGAQRCLELSVAYARRRHQFGRPISDFQAIRHRCADMHLEVESARCAAHHAALVAATDPGATELALAANLAAVTCAAAYLRVAIDNLRIHGGVGYDWNSEVQLHLRRAQDCELLLGGPSRHRRLAADALLAG